MRLFISAGEPSGDEHAAHLITEMKRHDSSLICEGFGGLEMQGQGCELLYNLTQNAVMGISQVIPLLAHFRRLVKQAEAHLTNNPPDAVVLVDFPGFNWWIARAAHRRGIPVYYYLPPQLWAWAPWRIRRVRKWVDHVICTLPFEYAWYTDRGIKCTWVGHPFFDEVADYKLDQGKLQKLTPVNNDQLVFALLPGSRTQEIENNWPIMLQVAAKVQQANPLIRWIAGCSRPEQQRRCEELQRDSGVQVEIEYESSQTSEVIEAADACLMVSGSVSLELLARRTPGIVLYRTKFYGRFAAKHLISCRFITLTNLIADDEIMPEIISCRDPANDIAQMEQLLTEWASNPDALAARREQLNTLANEVAIPGATARTVQLLLKHNVVANIDEIAA